MSHAATNWAVKLRGLKPAAKIVLWHLADRHHPDHGCFPSQSRLADDCEMSRASLNNHLKGLEAAGLIIRIQRRDTSSNRQKSTRYILGFEDAFAQHVESRVQDLDMEAVSKNEPVPCPNLSESRVQNLNTNSVREPLREPVRGSFDVFWDLVPTQHKKSKFQAERNWKKLSSNLRQEALDNAKAWFSWWATSNKDANPIHGSTYLDERRWQDEGWKPERKSPPLACGLYQHHIDAIKKRQTYLCRDIQSTQANLAVQAGLVTETECRNAGVPL